MEREKKFYIELYRKEEQLIRMVRRMKDGRVRIFIKDGKPVRAEQITKDRRI